MAATVRTSCTTCGPVEVRAKDVTVFACASNVQNAYGFRCPICSMWMVKDANPSVVTLLLRTGVHAESWPHLWAPDDQPDPTLGPISDAELLEFHEQLEHWPNTER